MSESIKAITSFFTSPEFTSFVNFLSVFGFLLTVYVGLTVRKIKYSYAAKIRVPALKIQVQTHISNLGGFLNDYQNNTNLILTEVAKLEPVIFALKNRLRRAERNKVNTVIYLLKNRRNHIQTTEAGVRELYNQLNGLISELEQWENDKSVES